MDTDNRPIRRALISVSDKTNVVEFAAGLVELGVEILSTGGTAALLEKSGIPVKEVSDYTGYPEMMDGRVKTLHPMVHGGILGRRGRDETVMADNGIQPIDLVVVNLYPFRQTVANPECTLENAIENIDIGGPTMLRAAAKNYRDVAVVVNSDDYGEVIAELDKNGGVTTIALRYRLACRAFEHTAGYDGAIADYLGSRDDTGTVRAFPSTFNSQFVLRQTMRYGENPHQSAAFYVDPGNSAANVSSATQCQGKEMSYNNIADTDAALGCVSQFPDGEACVIVKHANPCGVAVSTDQYSAYDKAFSTDPESAFGGIIAFSSPLGDDTARAILERQFVEVIAAPGISDDAMEILSSKPNIRVLNTIAGIENEPQSGGDPGSRVFRTVGGGLLVQDDDSELYGTLDVVTERSPASQEMDDLLFAWIVAKHVKSNAIVYASGNMTLGVGAGQMSRVNSARIAAIKAEHAGFDLAGSVMASDAFFPFRDGLDNAASVGIGAVIQPGGSMRDDEVIAAANEHGMAMVFTGMRHFRH